MLVENESKTDAQEFIPYTPINAAKSKIYYARGKILFGNDVVMDYDLKRFRSVILAFDPRSKSIRLNFLTDFGPGSLALTKLSPESEARRILFGGLNKLYDRPFEEGQAFFMAWESERVAVLRPIGNR